MKAYRFIFNIINLFFQKQERIVFISNIKVEENAIAMANFVADNYDFEVSLLLPKKDFKNVSSFIHHNVGLYKSPRLKSFSWASIKILCKSKYIFFTYPFFLKRFTKDQQYINLWHGVGHKKIAGVRIKNGGIAADTTIATSPMTQKMFADMFDVPLESVVIGGLPRNDLMMQSLPKKDKLKRSLRLTKFSKVLIWMPTFRRANNKNSAETKAIREVDNIFNVKGFDCNRFNDLLKNHNTLCLIKSHHFVENYNNSKEYSNIRMIDDNWVYEQNILLYQLLACTDALITDYSSVMIDYTLLDQPIFCIADDLDEYKKTQGLYFEDYENWVPTKLFQKQDHFLKAVKEFLLTEKDAYKEKRKKVRDLYFQYQDTNSAQRIAEQVFKKKVVSKNVKQFA